LGTDQKGRTQRQTIALKDVAYRLHAYVIPWPGNESELPAIYSQFERRASSGKCFYQPYFGCREFPAFFRLVDDDNQPPPCSINLDVGMMLYDVFDLSNPGDWYSKPAVSLFHAKIDNGVLLVPEYESPEVLKAVEVD
jgi:CRISPR-associated protein Cas5d